ncbi:MAG: glycosyltransferase family 2 protein [Alphaproteobacteria bacterium]|nr:glycosyltransferase family 2 protein [Alphaproteobacteria bacterium]
MTVPALTSVVMVTYQTGAILEKAVASVLAQTAPIELILVNNGNPPEIEAKLVARGKNDPRLRLVTGQGNVGFAKACNLGAKAAKGDHLLVLHADTLLKNDAVTRLLQHASGLMSPFMIGARLVDSKGRVKPEARYILPTPMTTVLATFHLKASFPKYRFDLHKEPMPELLTPVPGISGAFMFLPAKDFWLMKGFDEKFFWHAADADFCLRFHRAEGQVYLAPDIVALHQGRASAATTRIREESRARGWVHYYHENFGHTYPQPALWFLDAGFWSRFGFKMALFWWRGRRARKVR